VIFVRLHPLLFSLDILFPPARSLRILCPFFFFLTSPRRIEQAAFLKLFDIFSLPSSSPVLPLSVSTGSVTFSFPTFLAAFPTGQDASRLFPLFPRFAVPLPPHSRAPVPFPTGFRFSENPPLGSLSPFFPVSHLFPRPTSWLLFIVCLLPRVIVSLFYGVVADPCRIVLLFDLLLSRAAPSFPHDNVDF